MKPRTILEAFENTDAAYLDAAEPKNRNSRKALFIVLAAAAVVALTLCVIGGGMLLRHSGDAEPPINEEEVVRVLAANAKLNKAEISFDIDDKETALKLALDACNMKADELADVQFTFVSAQNLCFLRLTAKDGSYFFVCVDMNEKTVGCVVEGKEYLPDVDTWRRVYSMFDYIMLDDGNIGYYVNDDPASDQNVSDEDVIVFDDGSTGYRYHVDDDTANVQTVSDGAIIITDTDYRRMSKAWMEANRSFFTGMLDKVDENGEVYRTFYIVSAKGENAGEVLYKETFKPYDSDLIYNESCAIAVCTAAAKSRGGETIEYKGHMQYAETVDVGNKTAVLTYTEMYMDVDGVSYCYLLDHSGCLQAEPTLLGDGVEHSDDYMLAIATNSDVEIVTVW